MLTVNLPAKFLALCLVLDACPAVLVNKALYWMRLKTNVFQYRNVLKREQSNDKLKKVLLTLQCFHSQHPMEVRVGNSAVMTLMN